MCRALNSKVVGSSPIIGYRFLSSVGQSFSLLTERSLVRSQQEPFFFVMFIFALKKHTFWNSEVAITSRCDRGSPSSILGSGIDPVV